MQLILETAGGTVVTGVIDKYPKPAEPKVVSLRHEKTTALLGVEISAERQNAMLESLGLEFHAQLGSDDKGAITTAFRIPTFRVDLKREVDLIEEIARLHGVDKIPSTAPRGAVGTNAFDAVYDQLANARIAACQARCGRVCCPDCCTRCGTMSAGRITTWRCSSLAACSRA